MGSNVTARYYMCLTATYAGLAFVSSSVGGVHGLSYPLATAYNLTHGRSLGVLLPHVMDFNVASNPGKFASAAALMGKDTEGLSLIQAARLAAEAVREVLDTAELSYRLRDHGAREKDFPELAKETAAMEILYRNNPRSIREENICDIYQTAY